MEGDIIDAYPNPKLGIKIVNSRVSQITPYYYATALNLPLRRSGATVRDISPSTNVSIIRSVRGENKVLAKSPHTIFALANEATIMYHLHIITNTSIPLQLLRVLLNNNH